ncbi:MAG: hypothetical protein NZL95_07730 [Chitinophagales bacterium]|nr:hypothetical protein [Chitinophagales bacterium]MDW8428426.1 hypothetical protein [Chitinophagales bacterium]
MIIWQHLPIRGMALYPFVIYQNKTYASDARMVNHERIHLRQQLELLIVPFYLLYICNYLINRIRFGNHELAYREIIFEREAYACDHDLTYLKRRRFFAFLRFLRRSAQRP